MNALLQTRALCKSYDGRAALTRVDLEIREGEVHSLVGENGAGKSTLVRILSGLQAPDSGELKFASRSLREFTPATAQDSGIAVVHQDFDLAPNMTVAENLGLGDEPTWFPGLINHRALIKRAQAQLSAAQIDIDANTPVAQLSVAQRQLVAIARCVATGTRLLILDEPTSSLGADDIALLLAAIRRQQAAGVAVLFISHKLDEIFAVSDRISVFRDGCSVGTREAAQTSRQELVSMMVGRELTPHHRPVSPAGQPQRLLIRGLSTQALKSRVDLEIKRGEILGLYGLRGSGRTALIRALFGLDKLLQGEICLDGEPVNIRSPQRAIKAGIAWVCRDRKEKGLLPNMSVKENLTIAALKNLSRFGLINARREQAATQRYIERLRIRTSGGDQGITALSGGNQQKVMLARWLLCAPRLLVLDEPTVGVDVGAKAEIYALAQELAADGMSILLVSSELAELLALSDRIEVMHEGALVGSLDRNEATEERVMQLIHASALS
jgi:ABC-type sugar transport system ATPase subunit